MKDLKEIIRKIEGDRQKIEDAKKILGRDCLRTGKKLFTGCGSVQSSQKQWKIFWKM